LLQAAQDVGRRSGVAIFNAGQAEAVQRQLIANEYKERGEKLPTLPALEAIIKTATANEQYEADTLKKDFELIKLAINARLAQMSAAQT
ncbi:hypothetical protein OE165_27375, partial [Escherichia coli]|uniref:hypothetical protein n=1 Tax=Escherichia coli TaxID=562 RepID=UPI0021F31157